MSISSVVYDWKEEFIEVNYGIIVRIKQSNNPIEKILVL